MGTNKIKGGLADNKTVKDLADKHDTTVDAINKEVKKGTEVEMEHTDDKDKAEEIAMDHAYEDDKYYEKLKTIEEMVKTGLVGIIKEDVESTVVDESPDTISVLVKYNGRNAGIIMVTPANEEDTMEIVGTQFKEDYDTLFILNQAVNSLWGMFPEKKAFIVAPKPEGIESWNKLGFSRISKNYLISNRGH